MGGCGSPRESRVLNGVRSLEAAWEVKLVPLLPLVLRSSVLLLVDFFMCCAMAVSLYFCIFGSSTDKPSVGQCVQPATSHIRMLFLRVFERS